MGEPIRCFLLEPTDRERLRLRRYVASNVGRNCSLPHGYHDASATIGDEPDTGPASGDAWPRDDARWPTRCACGYEFGEDDHWQLVRDAIYRRADTGEEMTLRDAPPGAMWYADWTGVQGPDGRCLIVRCPPTHDWVVDGPASNGPGWTRTGTPPDVTATPSIGVPGRDGQYAFHGWLRAGWLVDA